MPPGHRPSAGDERLVVQGASVRITHMTPPTPGGFQSSSDQLSPTRHAAYCQESVLHWRSVEERGGA